MKKYIFKQQGNKTNLDEKLWFLFSYFSKNGSSFS